MGKPKRGSPTQGGSIPPPTHKTQGGGETVRLATLGVVVALTMLSLWNARQVNSHQEGIESRLGRIETQLGQVSKKVEGGLAKAAPPRRGPDPNRVYKIKTAGAPIKGPANAPITIAEFSDFQ